MFFFLKIWKFEKMFQITWVTGVLQLGKDGRIYFYECNRGITFSVIIMTLKTQIKCLLSGKKCICRSKGLLGNDPGKTLQPAVDFFKHFLKPSELW